MNYSKKRNGKLIRNSFLINFKKMSMNLRNFYQRLPKSLVLVRHRFNKLSCRVVKILSFKVRWRCARWGKELLNRDLPRLQKNWKTLLIMHSSHCSNLSKKCSLITLKNPLNWWVSSKSWIRWSFSKRLQRSNSNLKTSSTRSLVTFLLKSTKKC